MTPEQVKRLKDSLETVIASNSATAQNEDIDMELRSHCSSHAQGLSQALSMVKALEREVPQTLAEIATRECREHPGETYTADTPCPACK